MRDDIRQEEGDEMTASHQMVMPSLIIAPRGYFTPESEYRNAIREKEVVDGWVRWVRSFHWDLFITPTFGQPVSDDYARRSLEEFCWSIGNVNSAFLGWGGNQPQSGHLLINLTGSWKKNATGLNRRALMERRIRKLWTHGTEMEIKTFDARQASTAVRYFADHHEVELIGDPRRHRGVRK